jgi:predicted transcriptional regulator
MSRRLKITLPDALATQLDELAANAGEPVARLAGQMVRQGIADADTGEHVPAAHDQPASVVFGTDDEDTAEQRASWLEPYGGDREWRSWMWGGIVALHGRYPKALADLKVGWWESEAHVETLCALVVWRQLIDDTCRDPREELSFQVSLADYGHTLRQEGGSVTRAWQPGAPPSGWVR